MFNSKFSKEFLDLKDHSLFVFKGWKNQEKEKSFGSIFDLHLHFNLEFSQEFFFVFLISNSLYSHT